MILLRVGESGTKPVLFHLWQFKYAALAGETALNAISENLSIQSIDISLSCRADLRILAQDAVGGWTKSWHEVSYSAHLLWCCGFSVFSCARIMNVGTGLLRRKWEMKIDDHRHSIPSLICNVAASMKFAKYQANNLIPEWRDKYIDVINPLLSYWRSINMGKSSWKPLSASSAYRRRNMGNHNYRETKPLAATNNLFIPNCYH